MAPPILKEGDLAWISARISLNIESYIVLEVLENNNYKVNFK